MATIVYLSLGSNLGDRSAYLRGAITSLGALGKVKAVSSFYETEPQEFTAQPDFLNCAVALETELAAEPLLQGLLKIERSLGRIRGRRIGLLPKKGPRKIDIDILLYGDKVFDLPGLTIPHPQMAERRFALEPLAEIAPRVVHPILHRNARQLLEGLPAGQTVRMVES